MQVLFNKNFVKTLKKLTKADAVKVALIIALVEKSSFPIKSNNIKPLHGHHNVYRIRKGKILVIFVVDNQTAFFKEVGYRKDVYEGI